MNKTFVAQVWYWMFRIWLMRFKACLQKRRLKDTDCMLCVVCCLLKVESIWSLWFLCNHQLKKWQCYLRSSQLPRTLGLVYLAGLFHFVWRNCSAKGDWPFNWKLTTRRQTPVCLTFLFWKFDGCLWNMLDRVFCVIMEHYTGRPKKKKNRD